MIARSLACCIAVALGACSTLPTDVVRTPTQSFEQPEATALGRIIEPLVAEHPGESGVLLLERGRDALEQRIVLANIAERSLDAQYYIWNNDVSGRLLAEKLLQAAERGVRVRLLLDDFGVGNKDEPLAALNAHPDIQVRLYNPFSRHLRSSGGKLLATIFNFDRVNRRMHNKTFIVDGAAAILGGRNIGDEYFDAGQEINFLDLELLAVGPVVAKAARSFDLFWNSDWAYPVEAVVPIESNAQRDALFRRLRANVAADKLPYQLAASGADPQAEFAAGLADLVWARAELVSDIPGKTVDPANASPREHVGKYLLGLARDAESEILIESAYFIPAQPGMELFGQLRERGVRVRALTNSLASTDVPQIHAGYTRWRKELIETGVELYEFRPDAVACRQFLAAPGLCETALFSLHAKSMVFDRSIVYIGSFNLNQRSVYLNSEVGLIVYDPVLAQRVAQRIEANLAPPNSWRVTLDGQGRLQWLGEDGQRFDREPDTGFWQRFKTGFISLFPIEKYL